MTQHYIGVKQVVAWEQKGPKGDPGYAVKYADDGYVSWSPKAVFERAYLSMGTDNDGTRITVGMVNRFTDRVEAPVRVGNHAVVLTRLRNGFTIVENAVCVDPENYDERIAKQIIEGRVKVHVWRYLGFLLACARNGLQYSHAAAMADEAEVGQEPALAEDES